MCIAKLTWWQPYLITSDRLGNLEHSSVICLQEVNEICWEFDCTLILLTDKLMPAKLFIDCTEEL